MNPILQQLCADHRQMTRILFHLEREIRSYGGLSARAPSLDQVLDILDYIQVYPEIWHHPTEDLLYRRLLDQSSSGYAAVEEVMAEHEVLEMLTRRLLGLFNAIAVDQVVPRAELLKASYDFIRQQLHHIRREQALVFPLLEEAFTRQDWRWLQQQLAGQTGDRQMALGEYGHIYRQIIDTHAATVH